MQHELSRLDGPRQARADRPVEVHRAEQLPHRRRLAAAARAERNRARVTRELAVRADVRRLGVAHEIDAATRAALVRKIQCESKYTRRRRASCSCRRAARDSTRASNRGPDDERVNARAALVAALALLCAADARAAGPAFEGARAWKDLQALVAVGPRPAGSDGARRARALIAERLRQAGFRAREEAFQPGLANVIGERAGRTDELVLIATHFDARDVPAANESASGPALVLELARSLAAAPLQRTLGSCSSTATSRRTRRIRSPRSRAAAHSPRGWTARASSRACARWSWSRGSPTAICTSRRACSPRPSSWRARSRRRRASSRPCSSRFRARTSTATTCPSCAAGCARCCLSSTCASAPASRRASGPTLRATRLRTCRARASSAPGRSCSRSPDLSRWIP